MPRPAKGMVLCTPFGEVSKQLIYTQLELTSKAGFAISFYVLVLRNISIAYIRSVL